MPFFISEDKLGFDRLNAVFWHNSVSVTDILDSGIEHLNDRCFASREGDFRKV